MSAAKMPDPDPRFFRRKEAQALAVKGFFMGVAEVIPGVSGGTVALIMGVYKRLIDGIKSYTPRSVLAFISALPQLFKGGDRSGLWTASRAIYLDFLIPLGIGMVLAILLASRVIPDLLDNYPAQMNALFFGLILASTWVPFAAMKSRRAHHAIIAAGACVAAYLLTGLPAMQGTTNLAFVFFSGAIAICALVLPGVSGSYLLKAMGQYKLVLENLRSALKLDMESVVFIVVFLSGITVGIVIFVRVLSWLFKRYEGATLAALTGLILGALRSVWPFKAEDGLTNIAPQAFGTVEMVCALLFVVGLLVVGGLIVVDQKKGGSGPLSESPGAPGPGSGPDPA
jgi:putative membrane protein